MTQVSLKTRPWSVNQSLQACPCCHLPKNTNVAVSFEAAPLGGRPASAHCLQGGLAAVTDMGSVSFQSSDRLGSQRKCQGPSAATCASSGSYSLPPWWLVQAFCFTSVSPQEKRGDSPAHVTSRKGLPQQLGDNCDSSCGSAPSMHRSRKLLIRRHD